MPTNKAPAAYSSECVCGGTEGRHSPECLDAEMFHRAMNEQPAASRRFYVGPDIAGQSAIRYRGFPSHWRTTITWPGAYVGAFWRNLLGPLYVPFNPSQRRTLRRG